MSSTGTTTDCFSEPERCGYPGPHTTGPGGEGEAKCASYPEEGEKTITSAGEIKNKRFTSVQVRASNVTFNEDCIVGPNSSWAILNDYEGANFTVENSVISGKGPGLSESAEVSIANDKDEPNARAINDDITNCGECVHENWTLQNSYVLANAEAGAPPNEKHLEDWYGSGDTLVAEHDTLLNPGDQTAVLFGEQSCSVKLTNSFVAGGGFTFYGANHGGGQAGCATFEVKDDRFARKACKKGVVHESPGPGGDNCAGGGNPAVPGEHGEGSGGYWPDGGYFGLTVGSFSTWEGNYWDNNLAQIPAP